jgi:heme iron utilization protein
MDQTNNPTDLQSRLAADPGVVFDTAAREHGVSLQTVVETLPAQMRRFAPGTAFVEVMSDVANWGDVTFIVHSDDGVIEFSGPIPSGTLAQGYYNLSGRSGLHGHLRHERCAAIAFVERPFFGRPSAVMVFLNLEGGAMFKISVGRDEKRELLPHQLQAFRALADRLCQ